MNILLPWLTYGTFNTSIMIFFWVIINARYERGDKVKKQYKKLVQNLIKFQEEHPDQHLWTKNELFHSLATAENMVTFDKWNKWINKLFKDGCLERSCSNGIYQISICDAEETLDKLAGL